MANKLIKHLLGYGIAGNDGAVAATQAALTAVGSTAVVGVCTDWSGNVYLSDANEHIIIKVTEAGVVTVFAGKAGTSGRTNGIAANARFNEPMGIACDRSGYLYVADYGNNQIRKIAPNGDTCLLAGSASGVAGLTNGVNLSARFNKPIDVSVDYSGNVYVSDNGNNKIRIIRGVNTLDVAGSLTGVAGDVLGAGDAARFNSPYGISCDRSGRIFVADSGNKKIKMITTNFEVYGITCKDFSTSTVFDFDSLKYLEIDNSGFIYVVDYDVLDLVSRLIKLNQEGVGGTIVDFKYTYIGIAVSPNQSIYVTQSGVSFDSGSSESSSSLSSISSSSLSSSSLSSLSSSSTSLSSSSESSASSESSSQGSSLSSLSSESSSQGSSLSSLSSVSSVSSGSSLSSLSSVSSESSSSTVSESSSLSSLSSESSSQGSSASSLTSQSRSSASSLSSESSLSSQTV
jgi:hypothetical protein